MNKYIERERKKHREIKRDRQRERERERERDRYICNEIMFFKLLTKATDFLPQ